MSESNAAIRQHLRRSWAQRDGHGVWFYGTWLFNRYYGTAIVINVLVAIATAAVTVAWAGGLHG